jgi:FecR protein
MAYASAEGGGYGADASVIHFDSHADHIQVPDAELLFRGEYQRLGPDLVLTGPDGRNHIIPGYFSSEQHPALVAPNGASLAPDLVDLLAGSPTPGQYAQAQPTTPPDAIGKCEKVVGSVTVVRNGVAVALHVGDAVFKSDVVQTGANSSVGIGFPDGTALNLVANTRMALNDYSFDASSTSNSALFTLVEGTFAFVAGKVAHDGNMKVATPVATMGIRGTTVYFATVTSSLGAVQYLSQLFADYQTGHVGGVEWYDNNPASPTYGQVIDTITDTSQAHYFTPRFGQAPLINVQPATAAQLQNDIINDLFRVL